MKSPHLEAAVGANWSHEEQYEVSLQAYNEKCVEKGPEIVTTK